MSRESSGIDTIVLSSEAQALVAACIQTRSVTTNEDGESIIFAEHGVWKEVNRAFPIELWEKAKDDTGMIAFK